MKFRVYARIQANNFQRFDDDKKKELDTLVLWCAERDAGFLMAHDAVCMFLRYCGEHGTASEELIEALAIIALEERGYICDSRSVRDAGDTIELEARKAVS